MEPRSPELQAESIRWATGKPLYSVLKIKTSTRLQIKVSWNRCTCIWLLLKNYYAFKYTLESESVSHSAVSDALGPQGGPWSMVRPTTRVELMEMKRERLGKGGQLHVWSAPSNQPFGADGTVSHTTGHTEWMETISLWQRNIFFHDWKQRRQASVLARNHNPQTGEPPVVSTGTLGTCTKDSEDPLGLQ